MDKTVLDAYRDLYDVTIPNITYFIRQIDCRDGCPVNTDARGYMLALQKGDFLEGYNIARGPNPFASKCYAIEHLGARIFYNHKIVRIIMSGEPYPIKKNMVVGGGGNVAFDVASVTMVCLEARDEQIADEFEIEDGMEEEITLLNRLGPKEVKRDGEGRFALRWIR
jgi:hypothetical protein